MANDCLHIWPRNEFMMIALPNAVSCFVQSVVTSAVMALAADVVGLFKLCFPFLEVPGFLTFGGFGGLAYFMPRTAEARLMQTLLSRSVLAFILITQDGSFTCTLFLPFKDFDAVRYEVSGDLDYISVVFGLEAVLLSKENDFLT